jgi:hypothetical protein
VGLMEGGWAVWAGQGGCGCGPWYVWYSTLLVSTRVRVCILPGAAAQPPTPLCVWLAVSVTSLAFHPQHAAHPGRVLIHDFFNKCLTTYRFLCWLDSSAARCASWTCPGTRWAGGAGNPWARDCATPRPYSSCTPRSVRHTAVQTHNTTGLATHTHTHTHTHTISLTYTRVRVSGSNLAVDGHHGCGRQPHRKGARRGKQQLMRCGAAQLKRSSPTPAMSIQ